ncbi:MAG TPA: ABC transporter permease, partial [Gemmatimonadaceae bacterium]|nr:ABC transporter permease [Gemmatimonadaceae bacterium]
MQLLTVDAGDEAARRIALRADRPRPQIVIRAPAFTPLAIFGQLARLWRYRDLLVTLTAHRMNVRYKQSALGMAWAVVQPLALMLIYTLIFSNIARMPSDGAPYAVFAFTALLAWTTFSTALGNATNGLTGHAGLITKVYFPREILPLSYIIAALADFAIASVVLAALLLYYRIGLTLQVLWAVPIVAVMMLFALAVSLFLSALQVRFRDVGVGLPLLLQIWMFATPVIYPLAVVMQSRRLSDGFKFAYSLNPMVGIIENFRRVVLQGTGPDFRSLGMAVGVS